MGKSYNPTERMTREGMDIFVKGNLFVEFTENGEAVQKIPGGAIRLGMLTPKGTLILSVRIFPDNVTDNVFAALPVSTSQNVNTLKQLDKLKKRLNPHRYIGIPDRNNVMIRFAGPRMAVESCKL
jgi:hypothetical protein